MKLSVRQNLDVINGYALSSIPLSCTTKSVVTNGGGWPLASVGK